MITGYLISGTYIGQENIFVIINHLILKEHYYKYYIFVKPFPDFVSLSLSGNLNINFHVKL
jgi:hypothetical protein